jgi:SAM-dependent methyltransferase
VHQRWDKLPDGPFDVVLWTSSMHYEVDPDIVFKQVAERLTPDGLFVLECGVLDWPTKEMVLVSRKDHSLLYPTWPLLDALLSRWFSVRRVAPAEITPGDAVPRAVFHCAPRRPVVMLIVGDTRHGKSALANTLSPSATKVVSCDGVLARIANGQHQRTAFEEFVRDHHDGRIYRSIDEAGYTDEYVSLLAKMVVPSDALVVIEGYMTEAQAQGLAAKLKLIARVWSVERV